MSCTHVTSLISQTNTSLQAMRNLTRITKDSKKERNHPFIEQPKDMASRLSQIHVHAEPRVQVLLEGVVQDGKELPYCIMGVSSSLVAFILSLVLLKLQPKNLTLKFRQKQVVSGVLLLIHVFPL